MDDLMIDGTNSSPLVKLDASRGLAQLAGESYPENAFDFFEPIALWMRRFIAEETQPLLLELRLSYLNTSSTKCLVDILDELDEAYGKGRDVRVVWYCDKRNERARESAEEFGEDIDLPFEVVLEESAQ